MSCSGRCPVLRRGGLSTIPPSARASRAFSRHHQKATEQNGRGSGWRQAVGLPGGGPSKGVTSGVVKGSRKQPAGMGTVFVPLAVGCAHGRLVPIPLKNASPRGRFCLLYSLSLLFRTIQTTFEFLNLFLEFFLTRCSHARSEYRFLSGNEAMVQWLNSSSNAFASCKSLVSNPSVNQL